MLLVVALVFAGVGVFIIVEHFRFRARAETVEGEVIEVLERQSWSSPGSNAAQGRTYTQYIPVYQIAGPNGGTQRIESTQGSSKMNLPIGSRHKILIDPERPGTGRPISNNSFMWAAMCIAAGVFIFVMDWYDLFQTPHRGI